MSMIDELMRRKADFSPAQRALLEKWKRGESAQPAEPAAIPRRTADAAVPLSFTQQRLWFLDKLVPGNSAYTIPIALRLNGPLDLAALERALNQIVVRHEILRTIFPDVDGQPVQIVVPSLSLRLALADLAQERDPEAAAERRLTEETQRSFDLARGPLIRALLLRLGPEDHIALLSMHHIVVDGWSKGVLIHELAVLYVAAVQEQPADLPELPIQYADYALWQRQWLQEPEVRGQGSGARGQGPGVRGQGDKETRRQGAGRV